MSNPYFVLTDLDRSKRLIGYRVCFEPQDQPGTPVEVEDGYFPASYRNWEVALVAANSLRDEMNTADRMAYRVVPYGTKFALRDTKTGFFVYTDLKRCRTFSTAAKAEAEARRLTERDRQTEDEDYRDHCSLV